MKSTYFFLRYGALLSTILLLTNCTFKDDINELKDTIDDFTVYLTTPEFNTGVHFEFVDARTNEIIDDKDVTVTVSGQDAALLYNNIGSKQESYTSNWGTLDLIVDPHKADSASLATKPIQFAVTASLEGYSSKTQPVSISNTSIQTVRVLLANKNNPPEGVLFIETEVAVTTTADGKLTEDITIEVGGEAAQTMEQRLKGIVPPIYILTIPGGTSFTYSTGPITDLITHIRASVELDLTPPSEYISPSIPYFLPPVGDQGYFDPWSSINLSLFAKFKDQEIAATLLSNDMSRFYLNLPTINPSTGNNFFADEIIQRLNTRNNTIRQDTVRNVDNRLVIISNTNDLLNKSIAYGRMLAACSEEKPIILFEFPDPATTGSGNITSRIFSSESNKVIAELNTPYSNRPFSTQTVNVPLPIGNGSATFKSTGNLKFTPETIVIDNFCEKKVYNVKVESVTPPAGSDWINLNIDVSVTAESNSNFVIKPTLRLYYGTSRFTAVDLKNGKASLQISEGTEYKIRGAIGNTKAQGRFKVESDGPTSYKLTFTEQLTSGGSGAPMTLSVPKTANNEVTLKYVFPVSDDVLNNFK